jgi:DNA-binding XRE family transcriptional regulator
MKIWLTVAEGAEHAGVSRDTIYTACERGRTGGPHSWHYKFKWNGRRFRAALDDVWHDMSEES